MESQDYLKVVFSSWENLCSNAEYEFQIVLRLHLKSFFQFLREFGMHSVLLFIVYKHRGVDPGYKFGDS